MNLGPGESRQLVVPLFAMPPGLAERLIEAEQSGTLDFHNSPLVEIYRNHWKRECSVLIGNELAFSVEIEFECYILRWERFKAFVLRRSLPVADPRILSGAFERPE